MHCDHVPSAVATHVRSSGHSRPGTSSSQPLRMGLGVVEWHCLPHTAEAARRISPFIKMQSRSKPRREQSTHCDHVPSGFETHRCAPGQGRAPVALLQPAMKAWSSSPSSWESTAGGWPTAALGAGLVTPSPRRCSACSAHCPSTPSAARHSSSTARAGQGDCEGAGGRPGGRARRRRSPGNEERRQAQVLHRQGPGACVGAR